MASIGRTARTRLASGRFLLVLLLGWASAGCGVMGSPRPEASAPTGPPPVVLERGPISPAGEARAAELFARAREASQQGDHSSAVRLARRIVREFPSAPVSGRALDLLSREALESGDAEEADRAAARYLALLDPADPRVSGAVLTRARARWALGDPEGALDLLAHIEAWPAAEIAEARRAAASAADALDAEALESLAEAAPPGSPLAPVLLARSARALYFAGDRIRARNRARAALETGATGPDSVMAVGVLEGSVEPGPGQTPTLVLATLLPTSGSPALADFAALIEEGVEVAAASALEGIAEVRVDARDDGGEPVRAGALVREIEAEHAIGAVGFLNSETLDAAARSRERGLPLVSPTAVDVPRDLRGVYSLAGADPDAAAAVARYAARMGILRVAVIHSRSPESVEEAQAFAATYSGMGGQVVGMFPYQGGATFFGEQVRGAADALRADEIAALELGEEDTLHVELLDPVAVFVPAPPEDLEFLAPQITFFGLDTLGIQVLGTDGWTDPQLLATVDARHTTGVVATAPTGAGDGSPGYSRFKAAYEKHFQRTLLSSIPALGYDAALLLLEAVRRGARTSRQAGNALGGIQDLEGATGVLSIRGGRVVRRTELVRIDHGTLIPIG